MLLLVSIGLCFVGIGVLATSGVFLWRWPLFWWGVLIGLAALVVVVLPMGRFFLRVDRPDVYPRSEAHHRLIVYSVGWPVSGILLGSMAAMLDAVWMDIAFAAYVVVIALATPLAIGVARFRLREP